MDAAATAEDRAQAAGPPRSLRLRLSAGAALLSAVGDVVALLQVPRVHGPRDAAPLWVVVPPVGAVLLLTSAGLAQVLRAQPGPSGDAADRPGGPGPSLTTRPARQVHQVLRGG